MALDPSIPSVTPATGPQGQQANPQAIDQLARLLPKLYQPCANVWCLVGNGLSNQTFIQGPEGVIAVDSGECVEEMQAAVAALREHTNAPILACIYTHFHYVAGTTALAPETGGRPLKVVGHANIPVNRARVAGEIAPRATRGLIYQFGTQLPPEGANASLHCGLGLSLRNPNHAPYTPGYVPAQIEITQPTALNLAGLDVHIIPAPSDADDSVTLWLPDLSVCINNLVWPALFNVYAIRGEEFRDPRVLLEGIDAILELKPEHLLCTHGPPLSGAAVMPALIDARDAIQFLWDQTVRGINRGESMDELVHSVRLPEHYQRSHFTQQLYGLAEHHVRQIYNGLFGWFDERERNLLPLPPHDRHERLIQGFGGEDEVAKQAKQAIAREDWRWALELATWLVERTAASHADAERLAGVLRDIAQRTPAANIRNWCLTRALELDGSIDLNRFRKHHFRYADILQLAPEQTVRRLRVMVDPVLAANLDLHVGWQFSDGRRAGLHLRHSVAVPTDGDDTDLTLVMSFETWAEVLCGRLLLKDALTQGLVSTPVATQDKADKLRAFFASFEHAGLHLA